MASRRVDDAAATPLEDFAALAIQSSDWTPADDADSLSGAYRPVEDADLPAVSSTQDAEHVLAGITTNLTIPAEKARIDPLFLDSTFHLTARAELPGRSFVLTFEPPRPDQYRRSPARRNDERPWAYVRFDGVATVRPRDGEVHVGFPESRYVVVGFTAAPKREVESDNLPMSALDQEPSTVSTEQINSGALSPIYPPEDENSTPIPR